MKQILLFLVLLPILSFADKYGIEKVYHLTYTTATQKCSLDIVVTDSGKVKTERLCFNLTK